MSGGTELTLHGARLLVGASLRADGAAAIRAAVAGRRAAIITDSNVADPHARPLAAAIGAAMDDCAVVAAGEASKTRGEWARVTDWMLGRGFGRDAAVVAVGGGVIGDLAGFVAATYLRGVPLVQVPTSLLAMVDASVGGKTGVDTPQGKNLVGAFHHPVLVAADPDTLRTLPAVQVRNGFAEAVKHALLAGGQHFDRIGEDASHLLGASGFDRAAAADLVLRNVKVKAAIVERDADESGLRKVLNIGHTIGHAIEHVSGYAMLHGECVAIGLAVEARIAESIGVASAGLARRVADALRLAGLPSTLPGGMSAQAILDATRTDKKARGGVVEYALLRDIAAPAGEASGYGTPVPDDAVLAALQG